MEFHNVKLLPKGLPEIIAQLVPYEIYPDTKVIAFPHKGMKFNGHGGSGELGSVGFDHLTASHCIVLYPTMCCSNGGHGNDYPGTPSFRLWMGMLHTTLHEIGHMATYDLYYNLPHDYEHHYVNHHYVEKLADEWMECAMARILQRDPRLGQPVGALTGYPGMLAYRLRNGGKPWNNNPQCVAEWRGLKCDGQLGVGQVAWHSIYNILGGGRIFDLGPESLARLKGVARDLVHKAANALGIQRYAFSTNGRRYLMFNAGEAEAVYERLVENSTVLVDAYFMVKHQDLMAKAPSPPTEVPPEQMRLPF